MITMITMTSVAEGKIRELPNRDIETWFSQWRDS
jgi:hypothetical protein